MVVKQTAAIEPLLSSPSPWAQKQKFFQGNLQYADKMSQESSSVQCECCNFIAASFLQAALQSPLLQLHEQLTLLDEASKCLFEING
ncbi:hypothetical protein BOX15_Mlig023341g1 [Macrostomum lignano]|uniref:Uncharacterized protein n=1 Tax=Macrostomum lignano TaxID=282301 RepID=A0A267F5P7_9PLAT|nr:hypothetical protein BOX15_Mlig023341g1 [Macrostomum lignano]